MYNQQNRHYVLPAFSLNVYELCAYANFQPFQNIPFYLRKQETFENHLPKHLYQCNLNAVKRTRPHTPTQAGRRAGSATRIRNSCAAFVRLAGHFKDAVIELVTAVSA